MLCSEQKTFSESEKIKFCVKIWAVEYDFILFAKMYDEFFTSKSIFFIKKITFTKEKREK